MDLRETWKKLEAEKLSKPMDGSLSIPHQSKHPVTNIINTLKIGTWFIVFFWALFLVVFFMSDQLIVKAGIGMVVLTYTGLFAANVNILKKITLLNKLDGSTTQMLSGIHSLVSKALTFQQNFSWIFFPLCAAAGFVTGMSVRNDVASLLTAKPHLLINLLVTIIIITPAAYFITRWMIKISHGKYLKQIEDLIAQMKQE